MAGNATFMTWNPNKYNSTGSLRYEEGNTFVESTSGYPVVLSNMAPRSGKWYVEFYMNQNTGYNVVGIEQDGYNRYDNHLPTVIYQRHYLFYSHNGNIARRNADGTGSSTSYGSSWGAIRVTCVCTPSRFCTSKRRVLACINCAFSISSTVIITKCHKHTSVQI